MNKNRYFAQMTKEKYEIHPVKEQTINIIEEMQIMKPWNYNETKLLRLNQAIKMAICQ